MTGPGLSGPFWRFWPASTVSAAGDRVTFVAITLLAARLTQRWVCPSADSDCC